MAKKIINKNTYNITNEIDYKKLAEAIVSALNTNQQQSQNKNTFTNVMFSSICAFLFKGMAIITGCIVLLIFIYPFSKVLGLNDQDFIVSFSSIFSLVILAALFTTFTILFWKSSDEIALEKDKNYIVSLFSSMVSVAALVVASLSLLHLN